jgi:hypothetical protein
LNCGTNESALGGWGNNLYHNFHRLSGFALMLPFYEQGPLHQKIKAGGPYNGFTFNPWGCHPLQPRFTPFRQKIPTLLCPSDPAGPNKSDTGLGPVNYAFCVGDKIYHNVNAPSWQNPQRGIFGNRSKVGVESIKDGTSNTLALSEFTIFDGTIGKLHGDYVIISGSQLWQNPVVCMGAKGPDGMLVGQYASSHHRVGDAWAGGYPMIQGFTTVLPPNSPKCAVDRGEWSWGIFPPDSYHPGGVNTLAADGSTHFVAETVNSGNLAAREPAPYDNPPGTVPPVRPSPYGVWGALGSMDGGEATSGAF